MCVFSETLVFVVVILLFVDCLTFDLFVLCVAEKAESSTERE